MQPRPSVAELLACIADVLTLSIVPRLSGPEQHQARVAANLVAIVERELRLAPGAAAAELQIYARLIPTSRGDVHDLARARAELARALRAGLGEDHAATAASVWQGLMDVVRTDLSISKPGYDLWEGE